jgi:DNA-binding response OmpR family regulator
MVILLVEDEIPVQFMIWNLLKADGFTVLRAGDGVAALETSHNHPGPIDLLLTDVEMPRMDGLELCRRIAVERPETKVLIMSGALRERERVAMLPFLPKPFTPTALRDAIQAVVGRMPPS